MNAQHREAGADWLKAGGVRPTRQRLALAALLVGDGQDRHVTAEGLFAMTQDMPEKVSLATVYNTLKTFCEAGLLREITVDGTRSYFDTRMDDHPHFYWEDSSELSDAPAQDLEIARLPDAPDGAEISTVDVVIRLRRTSPARPDPECCRLPGPTGQARCVKDALSARRPDRSFPS